MCLHGSLLCYVC